MTHWNPRLSLWLDRAVIAKERGAWYGRIFKRFVEWLIFEVGL